MNAPSTDSISPSPQAPAAPAGYRACGGGYFTMVIGVLVLLVGVIMSIQGATMEISVESRSSSLLAERKVVNVDLMRQQELLTRFGCTAIIGGAVLMCLGQLISNSRYRVGPVD